LNTTLHLQSRIRKGAGHRGRLKSFDMSQINFPINRSETVEVLITNVNVSQFNFKDSETKLDNVKLFGIIFHTADVSTTPINARTVIPNAIQKKATITIVGKDGKEKVKSLPVETFFNDQKNMIELNGLEADIRKSYITLQDRAGLTVAMAFLVTFLYEELK
jgi:hypothetical protein